MKKLLAGALIFTSVTAFAEVSISKQFAISKVCSEDKNLCESLKALNISNEGAATRLGKHIPDSDGILTPFIFSANNGKTTVIIDNDENYKLAVTLKQND